MPTAGDDSSVTDVASAEVIDRATRELPFAQSALDGVGEAVGEALPRVAGALAVLILGLVLVRVLGRLAVRALIAARLDRLAERVGIHDFLARAGFERSLSRVLGVVLRVALALLVILAALSLSGLELLRESADQVLLFLPRLLAAIALVLVGLVVAGSARERVDRAAYQMDLRGPLGPLAQGAVLVVFAITALAQLGVPTAILTVIAAIAFGGCVLTVALALGLGGREVARELSAGRYVSSTFAVGQTISIDGVSGEILAIETASCLVETRGGGRIRVPHHLLLERPVEVREAVEGHRDE